MATTKEPKRVMSAAQVKAMEEKEKKVLQLRIQGVSFYKMGKEHGIKNADKIFRRAIQRDENAAFRRAEAVRLENARLDALQEGIWPAALSGNARAVEVALKVLERRSRMNGLDFADLISGQLVEIEQAKVRLMATALVKALDAAGASPEQRKAASLAFIGELRAAQHAVVQGQVVDDEPVLSPEDEDLL